MEHVLRGQDVEDLRVAPIHARAVKTGLEDRCHQCNVVWVHGGAWVVDERHQRPEPLGYDTVQDVQNHLRRALADIRTGLSCFPGRQSALRSSSQDDEEDIEMRTEINDLEGGERHLD